MGGRVASSFHLPLHLYSVKGRKMAKKDKQKRRLMRRANVGITWY